MEKKTRRKTASFSFDEKTIHEFETYCNRKRINRSRLVEDLVIQYLKESIPVKETPKGASNEIS